MNRLSTPRWMRLISKARLLPAPPRAPKPGKRIKLGKNFDVVHKRCDCCSPNISRFFLRKRIKGVRHYLVMTKSWNMMTQHMGWTDDEDSQQT